LDDDPSRTVGDPRSAHMIESTEREVWTTPDFVEYETPMEVTAYAARMD
jgi:coenzyme PQQ precursor peptide PqqA